MNDYVGSEKRMISVKEFCQIYGVGKTFTYKLMDTPSGSGRLSSIRLGGRRLIFVESAEKLMLQGGTDAS